MFTREQEAIERKIQEELEAKGIQSQRLDWKGIPFSGHWGISTSFFQIAAIEARSGKPVNVGQRAQQLAEEIAASLGTPQGFERIEAVRGYLNCYFSTPGYARRVIDEVIQGGDEFGRAKPTGETMMVEFSQPNTHKAFHVGHLRNVILGHAVCNILDFAGYQVIRANYIGDIGLHVIKWLWNYQKNHCGETPGEDKTRWMGDVYAEADRLFEQPGAEAEVRALFARWDRKEEDIVRLWEETRKWSLEGFDQIYGRLGVRFDRVYFESEVEESGKEVVRQLIEKKIARDERPDNPVIIPLDELLGLKEDFRVLVVLRSDGTSLYSTKDLALAIQKNNEYDLLRSIYVIDVRQSLYMRQIYKTLELMGYSWAERCYHLAYEIVNLPGNVTMSSRDGTVVLLDDLMHEAVQRALEIVKVKNPELDAQQQEEIAQKVALGAIKYPMVSRDNTKVVTFDWETALDYNGQASPYIQYAYVRASSILRKHEWTVPEPLTPSHELLPSEVQLIEALSRFPREVQRSAAELKTLHIANHVYDLARSFSDFYNECPVLQAEESVRTFRLRLVQAARQVIKNGLYLLGIDVPESM